MTEFRSQLEELLPCKELLFDGTPGFGRYASLLSHSVAHPAKMNTKLTEFLIIELTKPGDIVLDPMSGTGQTGLIAALNGRDAVCVELEEKFHAWQLETKKKFDSLQTFTEKGSLSCLLGDARELHKLSVDIVITSPPYAKSASGNDRKAFWERLASDPASTRFNRKRHPHTAEAYSENPENIGNLDHGKIDVVITSPPYSKDVVPHMSLRPGNVQEVRGYSENPNNIGNLTIDAIITSPPYSEGIGHAAGENASAEHEARLEMQRKYTDQMVSEGNIAALKHGDIDAIITSPPYGEAQEGKGIAVKGYRGKKHSPTDLVGERTYMPDKFEANGNISNLKFGSVDAVITSPPYEEAMSSKVHTLNTEKQQKLYGEKHWATQYGDSEAQIGNLKKETYLQAMLKVYSEMFNALKPGGMATVVVKPFVRNKKVVDLPFQTWLLMQKCGFKLTKLFKLRLDSQSFWRILYMKKYPEVPEIWHEYVLVCEKPRLN